MKNIKWTDNLKTGIKEIDNQHKIFYDYTNHLLNECLSSKIVDSQKINQHISKIRTFAVKHFHAEEKLMIEFNFPYYLPHRQKHRKILDKLMMYKVNSNHNKIDKQELIRFAYFLVEWLSTQTLNDDMKLADYLRENVGFCKKLMHKLKEIF